MRAPPWLRRIRARLRLAWGDRRRTVRVDKYPEAGLLIVFDWRAPDFFPRVSRIAWRRGRPGLPKRLRLVRVDRIRDRYLYAPSPWHLLHRFRAAVYTWKVKRTVKRLAREVGNDLAHDCHPGGSPLADPVKYRRNFEMK